MQVTKLEVNLTDSETRPYWQDTLMPTEPPTMRNPVSPPA